MAHMQPQPCDNGCCGECTSAPEVTCALVRDGSYSLEFTICYDISGADSARVEYRRSLTNELLDSQAITIVGGAQGGCYTVDTSLLETVLGYDDFFVDIIATNECGTTTCRTNESCGRGTFPNYDCADTTKCFDIAGCDVVKTFEYPTLADVPLVDHVPLEVTLAGWTGGLSWLNGVYVVGNSALCTSPSISDGFSQTYDDVDYQFPAATYTGIQGSVAFVLDGTGLRVTVRATHNDPVVYTFQSCTWIANWVFDIANEFFIYQTEECAPPPTSFDCPPTLLAANLPPWYEYRLTGQQTGSGALLSSPIVGRTEPANLCDIFGSVWRPLSTPADGTVSVAFQV